MHKNAIRLKQLRDSGAIEDELVWLEKRIDGLGLVVSNRGEWFDMESKKRVNANHIKCMLRNDYLAQRNILNGKVLDIVLSMLIKSMEKAGVIMFESPEYRHTFRKVECEKGTL